MTHRAQQIIAKVQSLLQASIEPAGVSPANVFAFRSLTLSEDQGEIPALTVNYGDDEPADLSQYGYIWSALEVVVTIYVVKPDESDIHDALMRIRSRVEYIISRDPALELPSFVLLTKYAGASAPELNAENDSIIGRLRSHWRVTYAMDQSDPGT